MDKIEFLKKCDDDYFNKGESELTDTEYDLLRSEAKKEFPEHPYFKTIGAPIKVEYETIDLPFVLGGLDKVTVDDVHKWIKGRKFQIVVTEKLDGVSIPCTYENSKLTFCATRGDGDIGQNILQKAIYFMPEINFNEKISLRGEMLLTGDAHLELGYKNRRNGTTGIIRKEEIIIDKLKMIKPIFYEILEYTNMPATEIERLKFIQSLGFYIPNWFMIDSDDPNLINVLCDKLAEYKEYSPYDIDGLVLTMNESQRENVLLPQNKVKFKVNESAKRCKVIDVEWNVTRMGYVKPVILIEPTEIMSTTVSRVSGFNYKFIKDHLIGEGAVIGVVRSGDVIPYVTEVFTPVYINMITTCPSCGTELVPEGNCDYVCTNKNCYQRNVLEIWHFLVNMEVDGISKKTIENLGVKSIPELYELPFDTIKNLPGFGERSAEIITEALKKSLYCKPEMLLASFGIPMIGKTLSKRLCSRFTLDELFDMVKNMKPTLFQKEMLKATLAIGDVASEMLIDHLLSFEGLYNFLKEEGLQFEKVDESTKFLKGIAFTLTGSGPMKRSDLQKLLESFGAEVKGIGKSTSYLVTNNPESTSSKMKKAAQYGVKVISYDELFSEFLEGV